eukprot:TRINITY_DN14265_c0_g8_i1.p1 TRINITY_DN14265_c0_g8~~TRINITY_DN14265_c0_g8_i1.p1  ORF type:complete len:452 (+),score=71.70 TRINITY_DN14265_c0_g8_i1:97-1356(+)
MDAEELAWWKARLRNRGARIPGFALVSKIADGTQAKVYRAARRRRPGEQENQNGDADVAIKVFRTDDAQAMLQTELNFLRTLQGHGNIIRVVESFEAHPKLNVLALELCDEDLFSHAISNHVSEGDGVRILRGVLSALKHVHEHEIVHRDVKPENVCLDKDGSARLMDFGLAALLSDLDEMRRACGTLGYMAPEMFSGKPYGTAVDMFAFGATFYFVLGKQLAFPKTAASDDSAGSKNRLCIVSFGNNFDDVSEESRESIRWCTQNLVSWRPKADVALAHAPFAPPLRSTHRTLSAAPLLRSAQRSRTEGSAGTALCPMAPAPRTGFARPTPLRSCLVSTRQQMATAAASAVSMCRQNVVSREVSACVKASIANEARGKTLAESLALIVTKDTLDELPFLGQVAVDTTDSLPALEPECD